jgi:hypothetical protein
VPIEDVAGSLPICAAEAARKPKLFVSATGSYANSSIGLTAIPSVGGELPTLNPAWHWGRGGRRYCAALRWRGAPGGTAGSGGGDAASAALDRQDRGRRGSAGRRADHVRGGVGSYRAGGSAQEVQAGSRQPIEARALASDARFSALSAAATLALAIGAR